MDEDRERALVARALAGDGGAFATLIGPYERALFNMAYRMVNDYEDARDLTQSALLKAYRGLRGFDTRHRFFSWTYRIVINESLNHLKRRRRQEPLEDRFASEDCSPEQRFDDREASALVQSALMDLAPGYRELVVLRHFLDLSHREIGALLTIPDQRVKSRLYTARQLLGQALRRRGVESA